MQKYSALCTDIPYKACMVNYATMKEIAKITVVPYGQ